MKAIGVIPARWASSRFEGKILALIQGKPMVQHVWEQAKKAEMLDEVYIACDDKRIRDASERFGAKVVMTPSDCQSGTERIVKGFKDSQAEIIVNIQGDEPLVEPRLIDELTQALLNDEKYLVATAIKAISSQEELENPNIVKVVTGLDGHALYFSRSVIPFSRDNEGYVPQRYFKHIGTYAYRKEFLAGFDSLPVSQLENTEKLEQLRFLEAGLKIKTIRTEYESVGVDTPEDLKKVTLLLHGR